MAFLADGLRGVIVGPNRRVRWWLASLIIVAAGLASLYRSLLEPSLGWRFEPSGTAVRAVPMRPQLPPLEGVSALEAGGVRVPLNAGLVIESAGIINSFAEQDAFFAQHRALWAMLQADAVRIVHAGGVTSAVPAQRGLAELGLRFWFPWVVALLSLSVGLAIWVDRPTGTPTLCYLVASVGYAFGMLCTASWGSRLLSQPPLGWAELHVASHLATFLISGGLCVLLWLHPRRLGGNWLPWLLAACVALSLAAEAWQWLPTIALAFRLPAVLLTALLGVIFALQWRACSGDAVQRAQLKWFGLLLAVSLSTVFVAYAVGATGQVVDIPQNYGLATVALLFVGLVPLVTRVGLFRLEAWWPRAWLWFLGGVLVVALDLFLMSALHWGADTAFAVAMAFAGWLYFPLRQLLWRRLVQGNLPAAREVLPQVLKLVTQGQGERSALHGQWRRLWDDLFQPLRMRDADVAQPPGISDEGRLLCVAAAPLPPLLLELPGRGARLFSPADAQAAREICELVRQGLAASEAFAQGAREERRRIASDLHDDLGAQLLTIAQAGSQAGDGGRIAGLARQALDEMRLSVRGMAGEARDAGEVLADWRSEVVTRLAAAGITPEWVADEPAADLMLPARMHVQLTRILRESVSNTIRHSGAGRCRVRVAFADGALQLDIEDDGSGLPAAGAGRMGHGLPSVERRVRTLEGGHHYETPAGGGTRLVVRVPLANSAVATPSANIEPT